MQRSLSQCTSVSSQDVMPTGEAENVVDGPAPPPPPIQMVPLTVESSATPLPALPMLVLSVMMLGEFLSSNVSVPFLLFMVKGFGLEAEADAAFWAGILVAMFFLSQFLTSLLWATLAERYGRRFVLVVTLFGSAISVTAFGLSKSIAQAMCIRLLQGIFAGAVGVARGSVVFITDKSNEGRAYAILGFCWGFGGLLGPIIGGSLERPLEKWPALHYWTFLRDFPYLLPSAVAGIILLFGSLLACFLGRDGGSAEDKIQAHPEKIEVRYPDLAVEEGGMFSTGSYSQSLNGSLRRNKLASYGLEIASNSPLPSSPAILRSPNIPIGRRAYAMSSSKSYAGSVRGSHSSFDRDAGSHRQIPTNSSPAFYASLTTQHNDRSHGDNLDDTNDTRSVAERIVFANENAVNNIADLWVAAALNPDENVFEIDANERGICDGVELEEGPRGRRDSRWDTRTPTRLASRRSNHTFSASRHRSSRRPSTIRLTAIPLDDSSTISQSFKDGRDLPSMFASPGLGIPLVLQEHLAHFSEIELPERELPPILESRGASVQHLSEAETTPLLLDTHVSLPASYASSRLPVLIIAQFGLLALHTTTHDQVFLSYVVSAYEAGGLNLSASDFAQIIALMGIAQIFYQFYLYPNVGPPRGRLSHLTMYRWGTFLFIPAYLTVALYRAPFAHPDGFKKIALMTALVLSTAIRYCAMTFAFTSISVLLNFMTPQEKIGYANGLAQTIVSLARCIGPVLGGWLWSSSVEGHPSGYPCGFAVCASMCAFALTLTIFIK